MNLRLRRKRLLMISVPLALLLLASACGDDDDDTSSAATTGATAATTATTAGSATTAAGGSATTARAAPATTAGGARYRLLEAHRHPQWLRLDASRPPSRRPIVAAFQEKASRSRSTTAAAAPARASRTSPTRSSTSPAPTAWSRTPTRPTQGRRVPLLPDRRRADHRLVQPDGVDELQLSADTLAKIFQGEITTWNDPAIAADNPGVTLPAPPITVAHRSDGSGTTSNFTKYLDKAAADVWTLGAGDTVTGRPTPRPAKEHRRGPDHQADRRRHRLRRLRRRQGVGPDVRLDQEQGRQVRRPDARRRLGGAGRGDGQRRPDLRPAGRGRRGRLPDHRATWILVYTKQYATRRRATPSRASSTTS